MTTLADLKSEAKKLELTGYSKLNKAELEKMIDGEKRRRENAQLDKIRQVKVTREAGPDYSLRMDEIELSIDPDFPVTVVKGKGIDNMARVRNYCNQPTNRDHLTAAQARRIRKNYRRGDMTVPLSLLFAGPSVNTAMGVA